MQIKDNQSYYKRYDEEYYERGVYTGISGYMNYGWMPELTLRMAHFLITNLNITTHHKVLDFGCAKGFLVKALRLMDVDAFGADVSDYAISRSDSAVSKYCFHITDCSDEKLYVNKYDFMISKDVFEHVPESELRKLLKMSINNYEKIFAVIPLASNDESGKYIIPDYDRDITHIIAKSKDWWTNLFNECGWKIANFSHSFPGCKENWTKSFPDGNGFFLLEKAI
jgi:SAM-dependent methyltransferase